MGSRRIRSSGSPATAWRHDRRHRANDHVHYACWGCNTCRHVSYPQTTWWAGPWELRAGCGYQRTNYCSR